MAVVIDPRFANDLFAEPTVQEHSMIGHGEGAVLLGAVEERVGCCAQRCQGLACIDMVS